MPTGLGQKIQNARKEQGLTLDELAKAAGVSKSYLWELENKTPPSPSASKLTGIANALRKPLEYFLDESDAMSEEDADDIAFYREYRKMPSDTKRKIRRMIDIWDDED